MRTTKLLRPWGRRLAVSSLAVAAVAAGTVAFAAVDPGGAQEIHACVRQGAIVAQGSLRVVDDAGQCRANETALSWNQQGPQGPSGAEGPRGPQGLPGLPGTGGSIPCPPLAPAPPPPAGSVFAFARFDGIKGDSTAEGHEDEIELTSVRGGIARPSGDPCSPARLRIDNLVLGKRLDSASVPLLQRAATGTVIPKVDINLDRPLGGGVAPRFLHYELTNVIVAQVQTDWTGGGLPTEEVTLAFSQICWEFFPRDPQGGQSDPIRACSDVTP